MWISADDKRKKFFMVGKGLKSCFVYCKFGNFHDCFIFPDGEFGEIKTLV